MGHNKWISQLDFTVCKIASDGLAFSIGGPGGQLIRTDPLSQYSAVRNCMRLPAKSTGCECSWYKLSCWNNKNWHTMAPVSNACETHVICGIFTYTWNIYQPQRAKAKLAQKKALVKWSTQLTCLTVHAKRDRKYWNIFAICDTPQT